MRVLFVSTNNEHSNTTYINYVRGLTDVCELTFFGPGYSTRKELEMGLYKYCQNKMFDVIILSFFFAKYRSEYMDIRYLFAEHRYLWSDFSIHDAIRYVDEIIEDIEKLDITKVLLYVDDLFYMYDWWDASIRDLLDRGYYLIAPGEQFIPVINDEDLTLHRCGANTRYSELINDYCGQIISMIVFAAGCDEFYWGPLDIRKYDWVVPGNTDENMYFQRKRILELLNSKKFKVYNSFIDRELPYRKNKNRIENSEYIQFSDKLTDMELGTNSPYLNARVSREKIAMWRENYKVSLRQSKASYADGSFAHCIVKKYFEIPAHGSVLFCDRLPSLKALGFVDGENMVLVNDEDIEDKAMRIFDDEINMQRIASNGRKLVKEKHTSRKRAEDTIKALEEICKGTYRSSYWENGDFIVRTNN